MFMWMSWDGDAGPALHSSSRQQAATVRYSGRIWTVPSALKCCALAEMVFKQIRFIFDIMIMILFNKAHHEHTHRYTFYFIILCLWFHSPFVLKIIFDLCLSNTPTRPAFHESLWGVSTVWVKNKVSRWVNSQELIIGASQWKYTLKINVGTGQKLIILN